MGIRMALLRQAKDLCSDRGHKPMVREKTEERRV